MQGLFFLRYASEDVADFQRNQAGDEPREKPPGGAAEAQGLAFEIGDVEIQESFPGVACQSELSKYA